eukprot:GHVL01009419.1.p1 GENE.GHVL01009419.1~~GHVL01009419.1.p1  ORF type:complete len:1424 (-),score=362.34 GHVL01009419.1:290-4249(-)
MFHIRCGSGYSKAGGVSPEKVICLFSHWSLITLDCKTSCQEYVITFDKAHKYDLKGEEAVDELLPHGSFKQVKCADGFYASHGRDPDMVMCNDGLWTPQTLRCKGYCQNNPFGNDESFNTDAYVVDGFGLGHGDERTIGCNSGYSPSNGADPDKIICKDGIWSIRTLECVKDCNEYDELDGDDAYSVQGDLSVHHGAIIRISCRKGSGYWPTWGGSKYHETIVCTNSKWSQRTIECTPNCDEYLNPLPSAYRVEGGGVHHGDRRTIFCNPGFLTSGSRSSETIVCSAGTWQQPTIRCYPQLIVHHTSSDSELDWEKWWQYKPQGVTSNQFTIYRPTRILSMWPVGDMLVRGNTLNIVQQHVGLRVLGNVQKPIGYKMIGKTHLSSFGAKFSNQFHPTEAISSWLPIAPDGYYCLSFVSKSELSIPSNDEIRCVPSRCVLHDGESTRANSPGKEVYIGNFHGVTVKQAGEIFTYKATRKRGTSNTFSPFDRYMRIKPECLLGEFDLEQPSKDKPDSSINIPRWFMDDCVSLFLANKLLFDEKTGIWLDPRGLSYPFLRPATNSTIPIFEKDDENKPGGWIMFNTERSGIPNFLVSSTSVRLHEIDRGMTVVLRLRPHSLNDLGHLRQTILASVPAPGVAGGNLYITFDPRMGDVDLAQVAGLNDHGRIGLWGGGENTVENLVLITQTPSIVNDEDILTLTITITVGGKSRFNINGQAITVSDDLWNIGLNKESVRFSEVNSDAPLDIGCELPIATEASAEVHLQSLNVTSHCYKGGIGFIGVWNRELSILEREYVEDYITTGGFNILFGLDRKEQEDEERGGAGGGIDTGFDTPDMGNGTASERTAELEIPENVSNGLMGAFFAHKLFTVTTREPLNLVEEWKDCRSATDVSMVLHAPPGDVSSPLLVEETPGDYYLSFGENTMVGKRQYLVSGNKIPIYDPNDGMTIMIQFTPTGITETATKLGKILSDEDNDEVEGGGGDEPPGDPDQHSFGCLLNYGNAKVSSGEFVQNMNFELFSDYSTKQVGILGGPTESNHYSDDTWTLTERNIIKNNEPTMIFLTLGISGCVELYRADDCHLWSAESDLGTEGDDELPSCLKKIQYSWGDRCTGGGTHGWNGLDWVNHATISPIDIGCLISGNSHSPETVVHLDEANPTDCFVGRMRWFTWYSRSLSVTEIAEAAHFYQNPDLSNQIKVMQGNETVTIDEADFAQPPPSLNETANLNITESLGTTEEEMEVVGQGDENDDIETFPTREEGPLGAPEKLLFNFEVKDDTIVSGTGEAGGVKEIRSNKTETLIVRSETIPTAPIRLFMIIYIYIQ